MKQAKNHSNKRREQTKSKSDQASGFLVLGPLASHFSDFRQQTNVGVMASAVTNAGDLSSHGYWSEAISKNGAIVLPYMPNAPFKAQLIGAMDVLDLAEGTLPKDDYKKWSETIVERAKNGVGTGIWVVYSMWMAKSLGLEVIMAAKPNKQLAMSWADPSNPHLTEQSWAASGREINGNTREFISTITTDLGDRVLRGTRHSEIRSVLEQLVKWMRANKSGIVYLATMLEKSHWPVLAGLRVHVVLPPLKDLVNASIGAMGGAIDESMLELNLNMLRNFAAATGRRTYGSVLEAVRAGGASVDLKPSPITEVSSVARAIRKNATSLATGDKPASLSPDQKDFFDWVNSRTKSHLEKSYALAFVDYVLPEKDRIMVGISPETEPLNAKTTAQFVDVALAEKRFAIVGNFHEKTIARYVEARLVTVVPLTQALLESERFAKGERSSRDTRGVSPGVLMWLTRKTKPMILGRIEGGSPIVEEALSEEQRQQMNIERPLLETGENPALKIDS
jgi:hypothetical protein